MIQMFGFTFVSLSGLSFKKRVLKKKVLSYLVKKMKQKYVFAKIS
jgi:hypothetical protein